MACPWYARLRRRLWLRDSCDVAFGLTDVRRICRLPGGLVRVVTARDMDTSERRLFRRKRSVPSLQPISEYSLATSRPSAPRHFRNCRFPAPNRFARGRSVGKHIATSEELSPESDSERRRPKGPRRDFSSKWYCCRHPPAVPLGREIPSRTFWASAFRVAFGR